MGWHRGRVCSHSMGSCISTTNKLFHRPNKRVGVDPPPYQVHTNYGIVEGKRTIVNGFESHCFLGIPYAKPPVGDLRFRKPEPPEQWKGVRQCHRFGSRCIQNDMFWDKFACHVPQSEDCLYLNVFAPAITPGKKYPVMFYIHGGGWMMDSAARYTPKNVTRLLVSKGIIVVTIQYRLGYLGFLCTGDEAAKGNFGLWDQLAALKWTKENIHAFGGDPEQITCAGQSAGAVSTDLLSISPLAQGLFTKKIVLGANSFCHWSIAKHEEITEYCRRKAKKLGWKPRSEGYSSLLEENEDMVEFLRGVPARRLGTTMIGCRPVFDEARLPLAPVIDGELIPDRLSLLRAEAPSMPSIVGVGEQESLLFIALGAKKCNGKDWMRTLDVISKKNKKLSLKEIQAATEAIYSNELKSASREQKERFVTLLSDIISNYACWKYMLHSQTHSEPCYAYSFDYTSKRMWGWLHAMIPFMAGTHASEIIYLFDCNYFYAPLPMTKTDRMVSENTAKWFTEFVINGNPNGDNSLPTWDPISKEKGTVNMLSISDKPYKKTEIFGNRMAKLEEILKDTQMFSARSDKSFSTTIS